MTSWPLISLTVRRGAQELEYPNSKHYRPNDNTEKRVVDQMNTKIDAQFIDPNFRVRR